MRILAGLSQATIDLANSKAACRGIAGKDISGAYWPDGTPTVLVNGKPSPACTNLVEMLGPGAAASEFARKGAGVRSDTLELAFSYD